jgi:hypothetical protein
MAEWRVGRLQQVGDGLEHRRWIVIQTPGHFLGDDLGAGLIRWFVHGNAGGPELVSDGRLEAAGRDDGDVNAERADFRGQRETHGVQRVFGGSIGAKIGP